jgi:hypothetical protein
VREETGTTLYDVVVVIMSLFFLLGNPHEEGVKPSLVFAL